MGDTQETVQSSAKGGASFIKTVLLILLPLIVGGAIVWGVAKQKPEFLGLPKDSTQIQTETAALLEEVGKLIVLPSDERPSVATITDVDKVKEQAFFKNAQNGDKVIIYLNAKKAILYRESEKKIIEVGPVNISRTSPSASPNGTPAASPEVQAATSTPASGN